MLRWWARATAQVLDAADLRVTIAGRSGESAPAGSSACLEGPFALLHGSVLRTIWKERSHVKNGHAERSAETLYNSTMAMFRDLADGRLAQVRRLTEADDAAAMPGKKSSIETFDYQWVHSGIVKRLTETRYLQVVLGGW